MNHDTQLRKQIAADIAFALELERPPAMVSERQLEQAQIRSRSSLQADRAKGRGIKYLKLRGLVKYPISAVIDFLIAGLRNHTGDDLTPAQRIATNCNLQKAQAKRQDTTQD